MKKYQYSTQEHDFASAYKSIVGIDLSKLHTHSENIYNDVLNREHDQSTIFHQLYYDNFTNKFSNIYESFIHDIVRPLFGNESIVYQRIPTFRVHLPNNIAVGEWHKDKWYRDQAWHEQTHEMNYYLPFTDAYGENTIWAESREDLGDYQPMNCNYGEFIQWDGVNLTHGNKVNSTPHTRISIDFRIMPFSRYKPSTHGSINMNSKFEIGGYYNFLK